MCSFLSIQDGNTALLVAALRGHVAVVQMLLEHNADVTICDKVLILNHLMLTIHEEYSVQYREWHQCHVLRDGYMTNVLLLIT